MSSSSAQSSKASQDQATRPVVFITGSTAGGIGAAVCQEYAEHGARVFAGVRKLEALGASLRANFNVTPVIVDVTDAASVEQAVMLIIEQAGQIDVLINNAGVNLATGPAIEVPLERYEKTFAVNYFGLIRVTQQVAHHMAQRRKGVIINVGSTAGYAHLPFSAAYASSKAAVHSLSDVMRIELAPLGVHVLCVAPGKIRSAIGDASLSNVSYPEPSSPFYTATSAIEARAQYSQKGRVTPAAELARAIRQAAEKPTWRRRAYLTYGIGSTRAWVLYFLPPFLRDRALSKLFNLHTIAATT